ncbi:MULTISPECIES: hypothetical protein [unclassified Janthinobacterium]|jgi:hypothetical protein|uniref:Uncharacterized protein n=1 Tax=Janthinobacterium lividum TaxID=29581 RepID=A0A1E8PSU6_9BURK|nr:hypothetical protein [Janthinobacterium sp. CG_23.4]MCL6485325.1 hypothetical protein [Janthinobacterium lividum]MDH6159876.1 hypothetical protein [Janthinobacterium sp. CG_23.4]OFJ49127.1 hypothetical protein BA896_009805 [Janthinobacterium lividum]
MWQTLIVALIVAAALLHFSTRYLPAGVRRAIVRGLVRCSFDEAKMSTLFKVAAGCASGCGSCGSCDSPPPSATPPADGSSKRVILMQVRR